MLYWPILWSTLVTRQESVPCIEGPICDFHKHDLSTPERISSKIPRHGHLKPAQTTISVGGVSGLRLTKVTRQDIYLISRLVLSRFSDS